MDGDDFDDLSRRLAVVPSRRGVLKGLGGGLAGALLWRAGPANAAGNSTCAQFCASTFGADTAAASQCTSEAAKGRGLCYTCGPKSTGGTKSICCTRTAAGTCSTYSGASCCTTTAANATATCVNGICGTTCNAGYKDCNGSCIPNTLCCNGACPGGYDCVNGGCFKQCDPNFVCTTTCSADCQCQPDNLFTGYHCLDAGKNAGSCSVDADCPSGSLCSFFLDGAGRHLCTYPCPCSV